MDRVLPHRAPVELEDFSTVLRGQMAMARAGASDDEVVAFLGVNPEALRQIAVRAADDEFRHHHGMGERATARLRNLSASQRQAAHDALVETAEAFLRIGMTLAYVRAGVGVPGQEEER